MNAGQQTRWRESNETTGKSSEYKIVTSYRVLRVNDLAFE
jgi:hypothetical protein